MSELRSVLGMVQYMARFIPNYSSVVAPLRESTYNIRWSWKSKHQTALKTLKVNMSITETMKYVDVNLHTELVVDAHPYGLGTILTD